MEIHDRLPFHPERRPKFRNRTDDMVKAGRRRRIDDEASIGGAVFVPKARYGRVEIGLQRLDRRAEPRIVAAASVDDIAA